MRKPLLFIVFFSLFLLGSCKKDTPTEPSKNQPKEDIVKNNSLFSFGNIHKGMFNEGDKYFKYIISLDAVNISENIFEKTVVQADLELILQNGNILSGKNSDLIFNVSSIESIKFWKPNQTKILGKHKELHTRALPNHFKEYPVNQALLILEMTAKDIVNNTERVVIHNIDITVDWKEFKEKKEEKMSATTSSKSGQANARQDNNTINISESKQTASSSTSDALNNLLTGNSGGAGNDNVDGSKGSKDISNYSNSYYDTDSGGRSSWGLQGRSLVSNTPYKPNCNETGTVVVKVTVNNQGVVTAAERNLKGTTNTAPCLVESAIKTAKTFRWKADNNAPASQIGFVVINFKVGG